MKLFKESMPFYRANLHTHTTASDGRRSPEDSMALYRSMGYDILALTDHRKVTLPHTVPQGLLLLPGIELDYALPGQVAHIVGLGIHSSFPCHPLPATPQAGIDAIREHGGRAILAHPAWSLNTTAFMCSLTGLSGSEVWNSLSTIPYNAVRADSASLLDVAAANGQLLPFVASDDTHFYAAEVARGWTMIQAEELSVPAVLSALDEGRFYATQGPAFHQVELKDGVLRVECSPAEAIVFASDTPWVADRSRCGKNQTQAEYAIQPGDTFIRCQVVDAQGRSAWTSPLKVR